MERELWKMVVAEVRKVKGRSDPRWTFSVEDVVLTYFWAVLCDRPVSWACRRCSWPVGAWRRPLPTPSTMSRRLRTAAVLEQIEAIERRVLQQPEATWVYAVDGSGTGEVDILDVIKLPEPDLALSLVVGSGFLALCSRRKQHRDVSCMLANREQR